MDIHPLYKMSIEEFLSGAVDLNLVIRDLWERVEVQLIDEDKVSLIRGAIYNSKTPEDSIQLLGAVIVYGYNYMSDVVESFSNNEYGEVRLRLIRDWELRNK